MKKKILTIFILFVSLCGVLFFVGSDMAVAGNYGLDEVTKGSSLNKNKDVSTMLGQVLGVALSLIGVAFFLLMLYGGILWMTARGNSQQTEKALNTIISAIIGLVIILSSYLLVQFVFKSAGGSGGGGQCANPIPELGTSCTVINQDCAGGVAACNTNRLCQSKSDSLCPQQCGDDFGCHTNTDCDQDTINKFYCTGGNERVCCKKLPAAQ